MNANAVELRPFVRWAMAVSRTVAAALDSAEFAGPVADLGEALQLATDLPFNPAQTREAYAESTACAAALLHLTPAGLLPPKALRWLLTSVGPLCQNPLRDACGLIAQPPDPPGLLAAKRLRQTRDAIPPPPRPPDAADPGPRMYFLEAFLQARAPDRRRQCGVFFTPRDVARIIVRRADWYLQHEFSVAGGLAGETLASVADPAVRMDSETAASLPLGILEPALGSGIFLAEVIQTVYRRWSEAQRSQDTAAASRRASWDRYVVQSLLPRLCGMELLLAGCAAASINLAVQLAATGFTFSQPARMPVYLVNALAGPAPASLLPLGSRLGEAVVADRNRCFTGPYPVILGNPPFSGVSRFAHSWIAGLLRGRLPEGGTGADYYQVDGQPLGERKLWLQDDYVKFLRLAHWHVERAGSGIVGMITNHGYLDNPTFRGLRWQLLRTFPRLEVIDLHGNRKKGERAAAGDSDESIFEIDQGTAIGLFRRPPRALGRCVEHAELWGDRARKLHRLGQAAERVGMTGIQPVRVAFTPQGPAYRFVPARSGCGAEYAQGIPLNVLMPAHVTAPVTARDHLVVAFTRQELCERLEQFRDPSLGDDQIRRRFFPNPRSRRYPAGDTRGWKLAEARRKLAALPDWRSSIQPCWYRPFDRRVIYWTRDMVDWPRGQVLACLVEGRAPALIARRQMLPHQPANFFWVVDRLTLDGVIRSDNRGSEYVFPGQIAPPANDPGGPWQANFCPAAIRRSSGLTGLEWRGVERGDPRHGFTAADLLAYVYAVFSAPSYRARYAELLSADFPRVPLPWSLEAFQGLRRLGHQLIALHLLHADDLQQSPTPAAASREEETGGRVAAGFPRFRDGYVWIHAKAAVAEVSEDVWTFHVGAHQVCRKWLRDRRGRRLDPDDLAGYRRILRAVQRTQQLLPALDRIVHEQGGWQAAFRKGAFAG